VPWTGEVRHVEGSTYEVRWRPAEAGLHRVHVRLEHQRFQEAVQGQNNDHSITVRQSRLSGSCLGIHFFHRCCMCPDLMGGAAYPRGDPCARSTVARTSRQRSGLAMTCR
jgi:hypothetical protein